MRRLAGGGGSGWGSSGGSGGARILKLGPENGIRLLLGGRFGTGAGARFDFA